MLSASRLMVSVLIEDNVFELSKQPVVFERSIDDSQEFAGSRAQPNG